MTNCRTMLSARRLAMESIGTLDLAARQAIELLTGAARRALQAQYTNEYARGNPRRAESLFGWNRQAVHRGLQEIESTYRRPDKIETRGRKRLESIEPRFLSLAKEHLQ